MISSGTPGRLTSRALGLAGAGAILVGIELRLFSYLHHRAFYVDEAMLALNVAGRSVAGLLRPLDYDQSAPLLFLWILKLATLLGGVGELELRFPLLLSGIALLLCYRPLARALGGDEAALLALTLLAISGPLIYYSADVKQYGNDALVTTVLCLLTLLVIRAPDSTRAWSALTIAGVIGPGVSMPAAFVLPAAMAALLADQRIRSRPGARRRLLLIGSVWLASFGVLYFLVYRPVMGNAYLHRFWEGTMLTPSAPDLRLRASRAMVGIMSQTPLRPEPASLKVLAVALVLGAVSIWRRKGLPEALLVGLPFVMAVSASVLGKYPMYERFLLFLAPLTLVAVAAVVFEGVRLLGPRATGAATLLLPALCFAAYLPQVLREQDRRLVREEGRESLRLVQREAAAEPVYVMASGLPAWAWYTTDWRNPDATRLAWFAGIAQAEGPSAPNGASRGHPVSDGEGLELIDRHRGLTALIGIRTGAQYNIDLGLRRTEPDSGWAEHEIRRLAALAAPYGWVFGAHTSDRALAELREALRQAGAVTVSVATEGRAIALRARFPRAPAASGTAAADTRLHPAVPRQR